MAHPAQPDIDALFAAYAEAWKTSAPEQLKPFWDTGSPPLYLAEEIEATLGDWAAVERYWTGNAGAHADVALTFSRGVIRDLSDGLVIAAYHMDWRIAFKDRPAMGPATTASRRCCETPTPAGD